MDASILALGMKQAAAYAAERLSRVVGRTLATPSAVYGIITTRCNLRCVMCHYWREDRTPEMAGRDWKRVLRQIRELTGPFHINISGGEPLLYQDLLDVLAYARSRQIRTGICTNGVLVDKAMARALVHDADVFNVNVSIDSHRPEVHDALRGRPGTLDKAAAAIEELNAAQPRFGSAARVVVKPTIMAPNLADLPGLVLWCRKLGVKGVNFQPMHEATPECRGLWPTDPDAIDAVVDELCAMKRQGEPIMNPVSHLRLLGGYLKRDLDPGERRFCYVGHRNLFVYATGNVRLCNGFEPVGNVMQDSVRSIWFSRPAEASRRRIARCRQLCLAVCVVDRGLWERVEYLRSFL